MRNRGRGRRLRRMKLHENAVGLRQLPGGEEACSDVVEILLRRAEFSSADGASQDNDGEDEAEDRNLAMANSSVKPSRPLRSQTLF